MSHDLGATSTHGIWRCSCGLALVTDGTDELEPRRMHRKHLDYVAAAEAEERELEAIVARHASRSRHPAFWGSE